MEMLERENKSLRTENEILRGQLDIWAHQLKRYHDIVVGSRELAKVTALSIRHLQDANFTMKRTEREAEKEWTKYKTRLEGYTAETGVVGNQL